jgi:fibronectin-binding autotransporter adhesin
LSGHGIIIAPITNNGTLIPGGTIGTLTVTGNVTQGELATLGIEVNPVANSLLAVKGGANTFFADGTLSFSFDKGNYFSPRLITFVTAAGGTLTDDGAPGFDSVTTSGLPPGGNPLKLVTIDTGGGSQSIAIVFAPGSALGGTGLPSVATGLLDQSQDITNLIFRHLQDGRSGSAGSASAALMPQLAYAGLSDGGGVAPDQVAQGPMGGWAAGPRVWVRPFGRSAQTDSQGFNVGFRDEGGGVVAGIDQHFGGGFLVGVAGAYSHDDFKTSGSLTNGSTNSWRVTGYGSWEMGPFAIDAQGGYTHDSIKTTRNLGLAGSPNESHGGDEGHAAVEGSYQAQFGRANVIPWVGFNYVHLSEGAFTETGGLPGFNLTVNSHTTDSAQFQAGVRVNSTFQMDNTWTLTPEARLGVSQELASTNRSVLAGFPGVGGAGTFLLTGVSPDRTAGLAGVGLVAKTSPALDLFIDADGRFSGNQKAGIISAGLRYTFGAPAPLPPPAAPPPPAPQAQPAPPPPSQAQVFVVYFDFDKSVLTPQASSIIRQAADAYKRTGAVTIKIDGYTDLAGTAQYNLGLSKRRADAVRAELVKDGVASTAVAEAWHGKDNPAVPTPDGVREPRNRRVTLALP